MSIVYAPRDLMYDPRSIYGYDPGSGLPRERPELLPLQPCPICGDREEHHGYGRTCYDCPEGRCQPKVVKARAEPARPGR